MNNGHVGGVLEGEHSTHFSILRRFIRRFSLSLPASALRPCLPFLRVSLSLFPFPAGFSLLIGICQREKEIDTGERETLLHVGVYQCVCVCVCVCVCSLVVSYRSGPSGSFVIRWPFFAHSIVGCDPIIRMAIFEDALRIPPASPNRSCGDFFASFSPPPSPPPFSLHPLLLPRLLEILGHIFFFGILGDS